MDCRSRYLYHRFPGDSLVWIGFCDRFRYWLYDCRADVEKRGTAARMDRFPFDLYDARYGDWCPFGALFVLANPIEIFKIWEGGLASHGGTLGIIIAIYFYSKRVSHKSMLWAFDKLVVPTGLVAAMIRLGNLMNHEIYGHSTDLPWGFRFIDNLHAWRMGAEPIFTAPSHPTQLYEAACYLVTFAICMWLYFKKEAWKKQGLIFGVFMICVFGSRFFIEFVKNDQEPFEAGMMLNMGQWLSIPFVLAGCWFVWRALRNGKLKIEN